MNKTKIFLLIGAFSLGAGITWFSLRTRPQAVIVVYKGIYEDQPVCIAKGTDLTLLQDAERRQITDTLQPVYWRYFHYMKKGAIFWVRSTGEDLKSDAAAPLRSSEEGWREISVDSGAYLQHDTLFTRKGFASYDGVLVTHR